jgi:hypothetical protein
MTALNVNSATGVIVGQMAWLSPELAQTFAIERYTGNSQNYIVPLAGANAVAAQQMGLSPSEFNNLPSATRNTIRSWVMDRYTIAGGWSPSNNRILANTFFSFVRSSGYRSTILGAYGGSRGLTYAGANAQAELIDGFIPEWGNGTTTANINAKKLAVTKMGWSHNKTVECAKAIRREKPQNIRTVFDNMIRHRNNGVSVTNTVLKLT